MKIQELLQIENAFQLVLILEEGDTQISLTWNDLDKKRVEEDFCEGCKTRELRESISGLVEKLVGNKVVTEESLKKVEPKKSVSAPAKISKKVIPVTPKVVKVPKTPTKKSITQKTSTSGGNRDVVIDRTTGLMWQKKPDGSVRIWKVAKRYCQNLTLGGYTDWVLPEIEVLRDMINKENLFDPWLEGERYWASSFSFSNNNSQTDSTSKCHIHFDLGLVTCIHNPWGFYVRCVRGGN